MADECDCCARAVANNGRSGWYREGCEKCRIRWISEQPRHVRDALAATMSPDELEKVRAAVVELWQARKKPAE